jgi:hypothetical protein
VEKKQHITAVTTDLGNWLNENLVCIWDDLANPKIGLNIIS